MRLGDRQIDVLTAAVSGDALYQRGRVYTDAHIHPYEMVQRLRELGLIRFGEHVPFRGVPIVLTAAGFAELARRDIMVGHRLKLSRYNRGGSPIRGGGTFYGVRADCECTWKARVNQAASAGGEAEARRQHGEHLSVVFGR